MKLYWAFWVTGMLGALVVEYFNMMEGNTVGIGAIIYLLCLILYNTFGGGR